MAAAKALTKSAIYQELAEKTELSKKDIGKVFDALTELIKKEIGKKAPGTFTLAGLMKIKRVQKKKTEDRMGTNPQTGQPMQIKGKPARTVVKVVALKSLKEMVK